MLKRAESFWVSFVRGDGCEHIASKDRFYRCPVDRHGSVSPNSCTFSCLVFHP
jgi:hypothetical protein